MTDLKTVEVPEEFFDETFIRHQRLVTEKCGREMSEPVSSTKTSPNIASTELDTGELEYLEIRYNESSHEPEEPCDHEPQKLHDTRRVCALPGPLSQSEMSDYRWHHER